MTVALALTTSLMWGLADFGGGLLTRRMSALTVVVVSQTLAALVLGAVVVAMGAWSEWGPQLWFAVAAGVVGPVGMLAFYKALSQGPMGIVSPLAALAVLVPVGAGLALGERPGWMQAVGLAVAVVGVLLAGGPEWGGAPAQRQTIALTVVAAVGFGAVMALIEHASSTTAGLFLALFVQRLLNIAVGGTALLVQARRGIAVMPARGPEGRRLVLAALPALAFVGLADVAANGTYMLAAQAGPVTVAAVLASLNPVVTAVAARGVLKEKLRSVQAAGAGMALAGTLLLASA